MYSPSFLNRLSSAQITLGVLLGMLITYWIGHQLQKYFIKKGINSAESGLSTIEGSLLGLLALILSFTFSISISRYDKRMNVVVEEANDIGTAILRADLYPDSIRTELRKEFRIYVDHRIKFFEVGPDLKAMYVALDSATKSQQRLWKIVADGSRDKDALVRSNMMIPALNNMIDVVTTRNSVLMAKVPDLILYLLFMLCLAGSFVLGYCGGKKPDIIIVTSFLIMISLAIYMILDLDRPRTGLINLNNVQNFITSLRSMLVDP